jgi:uncharacterized protein
MTTETNLQTILKSMKPLLHEGEYVFCTVDNTEAIDPNDLVMTFRESEGTTLIIRKETADKLNLKYDFIAAWISLMVHSSLEAVGLTASFSTALADEGISCNVVAGYYHDHLFIKHSDSQKAIAVLEKLSL